MDVDTVFELKTGDSRCILSALDFKPDHQLKYAVGTFDPKPKVRHEVAYRSCSHERREPSVSPDESRGLNKERP